jgi:hypothetical protein
MGAWSVSTSGENYIMEYSNGFKRSIRKNQVIKSNTYLGEEYSSSQSPNLLLATVIASVRSYSAGISTITFTPDGSNGWDVGIVANPTTVQLPSGQSIDFVNYHINHYLVGVETINLNGYLTADDTINTGANGAGIYEVNLSYTLLDGSYFTVAFLFVVDATNNILHSWNNNGTHVNSVSGLVMDLSADIVDVLDMPLTWKAFNGTLNSVGTGKDAVITLPVGTTDIGIEVTLDAVFSDYPDPTYSSGFSVVIS